MLDTLAGQIKELTTLASSLRLMPRFRVAGHADDTGPSTLNLSLSVARAGAVLALLKKRGVSADLMTIGGAGNLDPAEMGQTEKARSLNRRVTVTVRLEDEP